MTLPSPIFLVGVIDKTAEFVAKVGDDFEKKVAAQQSGQAKFAFLNPANPYRKYYDMRIQELREGRESSKPMLPKALQDMKAKEEEKRKKREERKMLADGLLKEYPAPPPPVFVLDHPYIAPVDMDIIKLTAQFVARNGNKFLQGLMTRESRNPQFEFIKPEHHLHAYFLALVDSYTKVLLLPPDERAKLAELAGSRDAILTRINNRYLYLAQQEKRKADKETVESDLKAEMARIDWLNFVIIGKLDFPQDESVKLAVPIDPRTGKWCITGLPVPLTADIFASGSGEDQLIEPADNEEEEEIMMEPEMAEREPGEELPAVSTTLPIRTDYVRERKSASTDTYLKSPITGEMVKESDFSEHMRIVLLDPQWKRQADIVMKRARQEASALAEDIGDNVSDFVKRRLHLFGGVDEQVEREEFRPKPTSTPTVIGPTLPPPPAEESRPKRQRK